MIDVKSAGAGVTAIAGIVGWVYAQFTPRHDFDAYVAQDRTKTVLDLIGVLAQTPESDVTRQTLCNALQQQITLICADASQHPFCLDRASLMAKAGCH